MNAIDTNVLVYSFDTDDPVRQQQAIALIDQLSANPNDTVLPWQVFVECLACLRCLSGRESGRARSESAPLSLAYLAAGQVETGNLEPQWTTVVSTARTGRGKENRPAD